MSDTLLGHFYRTNVGVRSRTFSASHDRIHHDTKVLRTIDRVSVFH